MTHKDLAPATWQADQADALDRLGIHPEPLGEELLADLEERRAWNRTAYRHLLRYNQRKRELAEPAIENWLADRPFDFEVVTLVREALDSIPERVADAEIEWYREEHKNRAASPKYKVRTFEPSFAWFPALFAALRVAKARARGEVLAEIKKLADPLTAFASNRLPVEALGFTPVSIKELKARTAAKTAARRAKKLAQTKATQQAEADCIEAIKVAEKRAQHKGLGGG